MYVVIEGIAYTSIVNLKFSIEADVTGIEVPINGLSVDIKTDDAISPATEIVLRGNGGETWARYWITEAVRTDSYYVRITAESILMMLDRITMPAEYYDDVSPPYTLRQVFSEVVSETGTQTMYGWEQTEGSTDYWTKSRSPNVGDALYDNSGIAYPAEYTVVSYNFNLGYPFITAKDYRTGITEQNDRDSSLDYTIYDNIYRIDPDLAEEWIEESTGITGYVPEQSARERLQWILFVTGAYVKSFFSELIEIKKVPETVTPIPINKVFWRPQIKYGDYVTAVVVKAYRYTEAQGEPATTDKWVKDEYGTVYIQTEQEFRLENTGLPFTVSPNEIVVSDVTIVNSLNVSAIMTRLGNYYFKRIELDADVVDAGEYLPGDKCMIPTVSNESVTGFIKSADFAFGNKQKAKLHLAQADVAAAVPLIIVYADSGEEVYRVTYYLPAGFAFKIENIYPKITNDNGFAIYYPVNDYAEGTMGSKETVIYEPCHVALLKKKKRLYIYAVDYAVQGGDELRID